MSIKRVSQLQIHMIHHDILRIQLELVPMIQEIVVEWLIIHFFAITPSELPYIEDFSSQLSSLQIGRLNCGHISCCQVFQ